MIFIRIQIISISILLLIGHCVKAQELDTALVHNIKQNKMEKFSFGGQWFLSFQQLDTINQATLKRGYLTFIQKFNETISARFTQDITLDEEGSDAGNIEMRLKYCYLRISNTFTPILKHSYIDVGLVSTPWVEFEQKVNDYRVQGSMFIERNKIYNSADFGLTYVALLGGTINKEYQEKVSSSYPGKFGSVCIGVYNGGGYHAVEENKNKTLEGRISLRPLPQKLPGMQLSYSTAYGKGNTIFVPDFYIHHYAVSFESQALTLISQYFDGTGDAEGKYTDTLNNAYRTEGFSNFGEYKIPTTKLALFGRFDYFNIANGSNNVYRTYIGGLCCRFYKENKALLSIDYTESKHSIKRIYEFAIEIRF